MKAKAFLKAEKTINHRAVADLMWPANKNAGVYLSKKLNDDRPWTDKDEQNATDVLRALGKRIDNLTQNQKQD